MKELYCMSGINDTAEGQSSSLLSPMDLAFEGRYVQRWIHVLNHAISQRKLELRRLQFHYRELKPSFAICRNN